MNHWLISYFDRVLKDGDHPRDLIGMNYLILGTFYGLFKNEGRN